MKSPTNSDASSGKTVALRAVTCARDFAQISHPSKLPVNPQCYCVKNLTFFHNLHSFLFLYYTCLVAHRAFTEVFYFSLSSEIFLAFFHDPALPLLVPFPYCPSPRRLRPSSFAFPHWCLANCDVTIIILIWPIILHLRGFTSSRSGFIFALSNSFLEWTWSCHCIWRIFRWHFYNTQTALSSPVIFYVTHPYNKTGNTGVTALALFSPKCHGTPNLLQSDERASCFE